MASNLVKKLQKVRLFSQLRQDDLKAIARQVKRVEYPAETVLCRQGEPGVTAYFVESGELRVVRVDAEGHQREVGRLGPGEYFGETSLLLGEPRDATVEVAEDTTLLYLEKNDFEQLLQERPSIVKALQLRSDVKRKLRTPRFAWLDPDEVVIVHKRKHTVILIGQLLFPCLVLTLALAGCGYIYTQAGATWTLIVGAFVATVGLLFVAYLTVNHFNDHYVVTNKRVVHDEHVLLIRAYRNEAPLQSIQNIQEIQQGLSARIFSFGNLMIETAGEPKGSVVFRGISNPEETRAAIFEQAERVRARARVEERTAIRNAILEHFGTQPSAERPAAPPAPPKKGRLQIKPPAWIKTLRRAFDYFLPAMRYEQGTVITWRKHWIALIGPIAPPTALIAVFTFLALYLLQVSPSDWVSLLLMYGVVMFVLLGWWLWRFEDWRNEIYQVTATRIIDVERLPFFLREERREASLDMIQNINLNIPSLLAHLLNYGSVTIETAGAGAFTFDYVKDPRGVQAEIFRRMDNFQRQQREQAAERHRTELLDWFSVYDQMRHPNATKRPPPTLHQQEP